MRIKASLKLIATIVFSLFLTMVFNVAAFADEIPAVENRCGAAETAQEYAAGTETETDGERESTPTQPQDGEASEQQFSGEAVQETDGEAVEPSDGNPEMNTADDAVNNPTDHSGFNYVVTVTDVNGSSVDVAGGGETLISDLLRNLGYEIGDNTVLDVNPDSIDTDTIDVAVNADGQLVLTDKGPFGKASKNLVVYLNGEAVELTLVDPTEISGELTAGNIGTAFGGTDLNVRLTGDVTVTDNASITLAQGTHDLYLNGYTLHGRNDATTALFEIGDEVTLNVYGGVDANSIGSGAIEAIKAVFRVIGNGILNIFGGSFSSTDEAAVQADGGTANILDGSFSGSGADVSAVTGTVSIAGGSFDNDPSAFLLDSANFKATESGGRYTAALKTDADTKAVSIRGGSMAAHATVSDAVKESGYVRLLRNSDENIAISYNKTVTLDLNGFVLNGASGDSVITNYGKLILKDLNPLEEHYFAYSKNNEWTWIENPTEMQKSGAIELASIDDSTADGTTVRVRGGIITGGNSSMGGGIDSVADYVSCSLIMNGGTVIGNKASSYGGGIRCGGEGTEFTMNGGAVIGNYSSSSGGGVYADFCGSSTLNGGSISYNSCGSYDGAGVYAKGKSFVMNGGSIFGNSARLGGGVRVDSDFVMNGGSIFGNSARSGGGVYVFGTFTMNGGSIFGNKAEYHGGVDINSNGMMSVGGNATVTGNTRFDGTTISNVYLPSGKTITVIPGYNGSIGVNTKNVPELDAPVSVTGKNEVNYSRYFFSDNSAYEIFNENDIVKLGLKPENEDDITQLGSMTETVGKGSSKQDVRIIVEAIEISRLNDKIRSAINSTFADRLLTPVDSYMLLNGKRVEVPSEQRFTLTFKTELFNGRLPSELRLWKVNADGTFTELSFSVDALGQLVIDNAQLGYYILTLA